MQNPTGRYTQLGVTSLHDLRKALEMAGDAGGAKPEGIELPAWLTSHILQLPQFTVSFIQEVEARKFPDREFERLRGVDAQALGTRIHEDVRKSGSKDPEQIKKIIADALVAVGVAGPLLAFGVMKLGVILIEAFPPAFVLAAILIVLGILILLATVALMLILTLVYHLIGHATQETEEWLAATN